MEANWVDGSIGIWATGTAGCGGLANLDVTVTPRGGASPFAEVVLRPIANPYTGRGPLCIIQALDTSITVHVPADIHGVRVWAPYPIEPGLREFAAVGDSAGTTGAGGEVETDTVSDGCLVGYVSHPGRTPRRYAFGAADSTGLGFQLQPKVLAFVRGQIGPPEVRCDGLPRLSLEMAAIGI